MQKRGMIVMRGDCVCVRGNGNLEPGSLVHERHAFPSRLPGKISPYVFPGLPEGIRRPFGEKPAPELAYACEPEMAGIAAIGAFYRGQRRKADAMMEVYGELVCRTAEAMRARFCKAADGEAFLGGLDAAMGEGGGPNGFFARQMDGNLMPLFIYDVGRRLGLEVLIVPICDSFYAKVGTWVFDPKKRRVAELDLNGMAPNARVASDIGHVKYEIFTAAASHNLLVTGDCEAAFELSMEAAKINPLDSWARYQAGTALARLGKLKEAMRHFEDAIRREADPELLSGYYVELASIRISTDGFSELLLAKEDCEAAIAHDCQNANAYLARAKIRRRLGECRGALEDCDTAIGMNSKLVDAYLERGELHGVFGNFIEAGKDFKKHAELTGKDWEAQPEGNP